MKRYFLTLMMFAVATTLFAQQNGERPYTAAEKVRWQKMSDALGAAFPKSYKDWFFDPCTCRDFSQWAEFNKAREPLTVVDNKNQPTGNHPYYVVKWIDKSEETENAINNLEIEEANAMVAKDQAKYDALNSKHDKLHDCSQLRIDAFINYTIGSTAGYRAGKNKIKLDIPITGYAYLYKVPVGSPLMDEDGDGVGQYDTYMDEALIIITPSPVKVVATPLTGKRNYISEEVTPVRVPETSLTAVKNIVIWIRGDEQRVREIIAQTDWKALQGLMGK